MASVSFGTIYKRFGDVGVIKDFNLEIADKGIYGVCRAFRLRQVNQSAHVGRRKKYPRRHPDRGRVVNDVPPRGSRIAMVFQSHALYHI